LVDLRILNPPPQDLPPQLAKCLKESQEAMLKAWDQVHVPPRRGTTSQ
jgi:hypothetical protein